MGFFYGFGHTYGATFDAKPGFLRHGVVGMGYSKGDKEAYDHMLFHEIDRGSIVFIKSYPPLSGLIIKAVGIVIDPNVTLPEDEPDEQKRALGSVIKVKWKWFPMEELGQEPLRLGKIADATNRVGTIYRESSARVKDAVLARLCA